MEGKIVFSGKIDGGLDIVVRYPTLADSEEACRYINALSQERTYILFQGEEITLEEEKKYIAEWVKKINRRNMVQLLAFNNNKQIGISGIDMLSRAEKHVGSFGLSVAKEFRGRGVGKILMDRVLEEAKNQIPDLKIVMLGVFANNNAAINMYKKAGFRQYGLLPEGISYRGQLVDHVYMYKNIRD